MQATSSVHNFGTCRCCLAVGHHEHIFGIREMEILMENLNLFLLADPRLPRGLCSKCLSAMADVQLFRQKVLMTEAELHRILKQELYTATSTVTNEKVLQQPKNEPFQMTNVKTEETLDPLRSESFDHIPELHQNECSQVMEIKSEEDDTKGNQDEYARDVALCDSKESLQNKCQDEEIKSEQDDTSNPDESDMAVCDSEDAGTLRTVQIECDTEVTEGVTDTPSEVLTDKEPAVCVRPTTSMVNRKLLELSVNKSIVICNELHLLIDKKLVLATEITKIRANIILILQNSTILPFRCTIERLFRCFYCEEQYRLFKDLRNHTEAAHTAGVKDYTIFKFLQSRQHKTINADISNTSCKLCNEKFQNLDDFVKHLIEIHKKVYHDVDIVKKGPPHGIYGTYLDKEVFKCHICGKEFMYYVQLNNHMNVHYDSVACPICEKKMSEARLKRHAWYHDQKNTTCPECNKTFTSTHLMRVHRKRYHIQLEKPITKCTECNATFRSTNEKFHHMEITHGIKRLKYKCEFCKSEYKHGNSLKRHLDAKHNPRASELLLVCEKCAYATMDKRTMRTHIEHHNGVRKFVCDYCKKKFRSKCSIELHIRMHINKKKYSCRLCGASYIQKHCVKTHIQTKHPNSSVDINIVKIEE